MKARCCTCGQPDQLGQVIEPRHVAMMNTMMRETLLSGTARKAEIPGWMAAGKTGTSQDFRDAWFIGYTANLVTGVWLGNDDNSPTRKATGGGLPVEVWTRFMRAAHQGVPVAGLPKLASAAACSRTCFRRRRRTAHRQASQHRRRYRSRRPPRAVRIGRRRRAPRRHHPIHRRVRKPRRDWMAGWWIGCSGGNRSIAGAGHHSNCPCVPAKQGRRDILILDPVAMKAVKAASWRRRRGFPPKRAGTNPRRRRSRAGCIRTRPDGRWSWANSCRE